MLGEEEKDKVSGGGGNRRTYSRSVSWTERPAPRKPSSKPQWNGKARACLPPLSITRPSIEEWPKAGSDDIGIWSNPPTPGAKPGSITPCETSTSDQPPREFECMKEKLAFFDNECSRILDHIYLGSEAIAKNREILRQNRITHVLNCVGFVCPEYFNNELVYKTLWLQDCPTEDITSILYDVFDYFEDVLEQKGRVFVHCCKGVSRSTSLVIAYLMWKEGKSFDDAFQLVKSARGVTNPNVGFACQLLQCQKRVHALPASPTSVLRMYRMAPHSPYDPLHLVPKMLCEPGLDKLDSRGAFIVHVPSTLYVWIGKHCSQLMLDNAKAAASQIFRYEKAHCPVFTVRDGEESFAFWDALSYTKSVSDGVHVKFEEKQRKLDDYDLDFEIFHRALVGGIVPPFPLSETRSKMCLPARENGWNRLRRKFSDGLVKESVITCKFNSGLHSWNTCGEVEDVSPADSLMPSASSSQSDSPDSFASCATSIGWTKNNFTVGFIAPDTKISRSYSFSSLLISKLKFNSTSPSITTPTSESSSLTVSPVSSNLSDFSFVSAQSSPCKPMSKDVDLGKHDLLEDIVGSVEENTCLPKNATSPPPEEAISVSHTLQGTSLCSNNGDTLPSQMILLSIDEASQLKVD